jgi:hypothetical protein
MNPKRKEVKEMKRLRRLILVGLVLVVLSICLAPVAGVSASKPIEVSGTHSGPMPDPDEIKVTGANEHRYWEWRGPSTWSGDVINGQRFFEFRVVWHYAKDNANVHMTAHSYGLFEGTITINGTDYYGTAIMNGQMHLTDPPPPPVWYTAQVHIRGISGDLVGLHGVLYCTPGSYTGKIHFDPPRD